MIVVVAFIVPVFVGIFEEIAEESPATSAELPFLTQITVGVSDADHRLLVHRPADPRRADLRLPPVEEDRDAAAISGTR